jgi:hypothetical protein
MHVDLEKKEFMSRINFFVLIVPSIAKSGLEHLTETNIDQQIELVTYD